VHRALSALDFVETHPLAEKSFCFYLKPTAINKL